MKRVTREFWEDLSGQEHDTDFSCANSTIDDAIIWMVDGKDNQIIKNYDALVESFNFMLAKMAEIKNSKKPKSKGRKNHGKN